MGLYLTIFDGELELDGVEVGSYSDLDHLKSYIMKYIENGKFGSKCPIFMLHEDSDGHWTPKESKKLKKELRKISRAFDKLPPFEFESGWQADVIENQGLAIRSLKDCFFDVDGVPLFDRLIELATLSYHKKLPILFQ